MTDETLTITLRDLIEALHLTSHAFPTLWAVTDGCGCQERGEVIWSRLAETFDPNAAAVAESARRIRERLEDAESDRLLAKMEDWDEAREDFNVEGQPEFNGAFR